MENKKIGIITIVDYNNYGNRLQNYATQQILKKNGFRVETIKNSPPQRKIYKGIKKYLIIIYSIILKIKNRKRNIKFMSFTDDYIVESNFKVEGETRNLAKLNEYDGLVVGSDQIWNPNFRRGFFLDLVEGLGVPSISLSASFGINELPLEYLEFYRKNISNFKKISVREYEGSKIINKLSNKEVHVLLDPTMMLSKDEWNEVSKEHVNKPKAKYILTYSLGGLTDDVQELIKILNKDNEYELVNLGDKNVKKYYNSGPSEFIDFIKDASLLITDSFHGIVFSVIFQTPFVMFERTDYIGDKSMNSRLNTFSKHFDVDDRKIENVKLSEIFNINFNDINNNLYIKQREFELFLKEGTAYFEK